MKKLLYGPQLHNPHPSNTIIAFDIHEVLFQKDYKKIARLVMNNKRAFKLVLHMFHPRVIKTLWRLRTKESVVEEYIMRLAKESKHFREFIPLGIEVANAQKPIPHTIELVKQLHAAGYRLDIISNIGNIIYYDLAEKFPDIFALFSNIHVAQAQTNYLAKPHPQVYERYQERHNTDNCNIVFIDDKRKNLRAAAEFGMTGILFTNAHDLEDHLRRFSLLSASSNQ